MSSNKSKFKWTAEQSRAFNQIKKEMARKILLIYPDFKKTFHLYTDASDFQLGSVLTQDDPIAFYSRKLNPAQRNYTVMKKELLSIIESLEHFRNMLIGFKIVIHSDHKNLSFNSFRSERVRRWRLLLEEYDYTFVYTPGKNNFIADLLSRYPMHSLPSESTEDTDLLMLDDVNVADDDDDNVCPVDYAIIAQH